LSLSIVEHVRRHSRLNAVDQSVAASVTHHQRYVNDKNLRNLYILKTFSKI